MTQEWERHLQKLRSVRAPRGTEERIAEGPTGPSDAFAPGARQRVLAGLVAFGVFAAAGVFAYRGFRADELSTIGEEQESQSLVISVAIENAPEPDAVATLEYGDKVLEACTSGVAIELPDGREANYSTDCDTPGPIQLPAGTPFEFEGEGAFTVEMREGPPADAGPGVYELDLLVTWTPSDTVVEAEASFVASIEIVEPRVVAEPLVLSIWVDDQQTFEPHASLTYAGEERDLYCRSYFVTWVDGGGEGLEPLCGPGPALTVPVGTELQIVSDREAEVDVRPAHPTGELGDVGVTIEVTWPRTDVWRSAEASFQARLMVVEGGEPSASPSGDLLVGSGTVLQEEGAKPELCLGGVQESLPPQCSGVPLNGWDWELVDGEQAWRGTTWGDATVTGRFDGRGFVVSSVGSYEPAPDVGFDFTVPCEEPDGGWVATDPARTSDDDRLAATRDAEAEPDHTASWISYLTPPTEGTEDPGPYVLVLGFTGDLDRHRAEAAKLWGGPLCVFEQHRTFRELRSIQRTLDDVAADVGAEMTFSDIDVSSNRVEMGVIVTSPELERVLAERFGEGAVRVVPALRPVD